MQNEQHPVSPEMRERIQKELKIIEEIHNVKIIYACESGSRGWGFSSTDSDYDVRFIYVNHPKHYVRVDREHHETIEHVVNKDLDICGWSITKTLKLLYKSNPTLIEWLKSPIVYHIEVEDYNKLFELAYKYFVHIAGHEHYLSMTHTTRKEWLLTDPVRMKKYFYALRPALAALWIERKLEIPPMVFQDLLTSVEDPQLLHEIEKLVKIKRTFGESKYISRIKIIDDFINDTLAREKPVFPSYERAEIFDLTNLAWDLSNKYSSELKPHLVVKEEGVYVNK